MSTGGYGEQYYHPAMDQDEVYVVDEAVAAGVNGDVEDNTSHLQPEDLHGVQSRTFDIDIEGSLADFKGDRAVWKLSPDNVKSLRSVISTHNRAHATDNDMTGKLTHAIVLRATVLNVQNTFPVKLGVNIPVLVPGQYTSNSRYAYTLQPDTPFTPVNEDITSPNNLFTRHMYKTWRKIDPDSISEELHILDKDAYIRPSGIAWKVLEDNVANNQLQGYEDHYWEMYDLAQQRPGTRVPIDKELAVFIRDAIQERMEPIQRSFVDLNNFHATFQRADGQPLKSWRGIMGEVSNQGEETKGYYKNDALQRTNRAHIKLKLDFVLY